MLKIFSANSSYFLGIVLLICICIFSSNLLVSPVDAQEQEIGPQPKPPLGLNSRGARVGPIVIASIGETWPKPQIQINGTGKPMLIRPSLFRFEVIGNDCDILEDALKRYYTIILKSNRYVLAHKNYNEYMNNHENSLDFDGYLDLAKVNVRSPCDIWPHEDMDESYNLSINTAFLPGEATITSNTIWGMLRALETFSQLIHPTDDFTAMQIKSNEIIDFPRFGYRSLLLDSARHFLPKGMIYDNLDLMAMNKLNILHWHMTDNEAFPYRSETFPNLSARGAYHPYTHEYTKQDVKDILEYARFRGIRVIVEFDTPGHVWSWGPGQPGLLTPCYNNETLEPDGTFGHIDISNEANYDFFRQFFQEIVQTFPEPFIHLGGDEVDNICWESNPNVRTFMERMGFGDDYSLLQDYHMKRMVEIIKSFSDKARTTIGWQEVFFNNQAADKDMIVHIWIREELADLIANATFAGHRVLVGACWYLDQISWGVDWYKYYACDPQNFNGTEEQKQLVLGGGPNMWAEHIDPTNLIPLLWPRASVPAERLWSAASVNDTKEAAPRLEEHRCRLLRRGYHAQPPNGAGFCLGEF